MERKQFTIEHLGCANCAAKMEEKMNRLPGVTASITFATRTLSVTAEHPDALLPRLQKIVSSLEPDARIVTGAATPASTHCHCDHDHGHHHHDHSHDAPSRWEGLSLLLGGLLFGAGLLLPHPWSLGVFLLAYGLLGWQVLYTAGKNLLRGHVFDEHFLMSLATLGAFVIREYPEAVGVMLFYRVGEFFEDKAVRRSRRQIMDAVDLRPEQVNLVTDSGIRVIPAENARIGDVLLVRPGDRIPVDGTVLQGSSRLDTAPITGEPMPRQVTAGDAVLSGCVNLEGILHLQVDALLSQSMVTRILQAVEDAAAAKPRLQRFITRFARIYTPAVVTAAALIATLPSLITGNWGYWVYTALSFLVMSCPCALVLSVPLAFFSGIGRGGKAGILFKGGDTLEALAAVRMVALDKTGTVTEGVFRVQSVTGGEETLLLCAAAEQYSTHPIGKSICQEAQRRRLTLPEAQQIEELPGLGIRARIGGGEVLCGSAALLEQAGISVPAIQDTGSTLVLCSADGQFLGSIHIADSIKPDAKETVAQLHKLGLATAMLTGDRQESADAVGAATGIQSVHARLLPTGKLEVLRTLQHSHGKLLFVGDGINDAPVLAGADVGAAMGSGSDAAISAADLVYMTGRTDAIVQSIRIARRTRAIALQNVVFALAVKAVVMALGLFGHACLWLAVFADSGVALLCVLNALRGLYGKQ